MVKLSRRIPVSETVFKYLTNEVPQKFLEKNPSFDGKKITYEQVQRSMIKIYLDVFWLEEKNGNKESDRN